jgi:hypothetical protein
MLKNIHLFAVHELILWCFVLDKWRPWWIPAICGITSAQLFVGTKTLTADVYPIKSDKQFVNTLLDNITQCGTPTKLISNRAQVEISERVLRPLHISTWQSKPHQQHQNPAEHQYQNIK